MPDSTATARRDYRCPERIAERKATSNSGTSRDADGRVVPESQQEIGHDLTLREPTKVVCQYRSLLVLFGGPLDRTVDTMTLQRWVRIALGYHIVVGTQIGLWALLAPRSFYDGFPGLGRSWVGVDGPFNEHLIRDVGALNLAVVVLYGAAWMGLGHQLVRASGAASLVWGVPHALYHLFNTDGLAGIDVAMSLSGLVVHVIVGAGLVWAGGRLERVRELITDRPIRGGDVMSKRIFVAGASGVLGRRVVSALVTAGYEVTANVRNPEAAARAERAGATPATIDLFNPTTTARLAGEHDAIVNVATSIPTGVSAARRSAWKINDRLRREASANLSAAMADVEGRYVGESITFPYVGQR